MVQLPDKIRHSRQLFFVPSTNDGGSTEVCVCVCVCVCVFVCALAVLFPLFQTLPQVLGLLAQDGILRLISLHHCKVIFQLGSDQLVHIAHSMTMTDNT